MFFEGLCSLKCEVARGCFYYLHRPKYITESPGTTLCSTQTTLSHLLSLTHELWKYFNWGHEISKFFHYQHSSEVPWTLEVEKQRNIN